MFDICIHNRYGNIDIQNGPFIVCRISNGIYTSDLYTLIVDKYTIAGGDEMLL